MKFLKWLAPKAFNDGLSRCNALGKKLILEKPVERFLDVGCGNGILTSEFAKILKPKEIYGVELVGECRTQAEAKGIRCFSFDLNEEWKFQDNYFDFILSSQAIEHLHNTRLYLEECFRCLKPGGQLILLTENLASWVNIFALLCGWQPFSSANINGWYLGNPFIWHINEPKDIGFLEKWHKSGASGVVGHVRLLAYKGLADLLQKAGFDDIKILSRGYLPFWGIISDFFCWLDRRHGHFLVARAKKPDTSGAH